MVIFSVMEDELEMVVLFGMFSVEIGDFQGFNFYVGVLVGVGVY